MLAQDQPKNGLRYHDTLLISILRYRGLGSAMLLDLIPGPSVRLCFKSVARSRGSPLQDELLLEKASSI
jgi:hypothetical protein